jgi:uncharacterized membrane protein
MDWFLKNLVGIENVHFSEDSELSIRFLNAPELWIILLLLVPATIFIARWFYKRETGALGGPSRFLLTGFRIVLIWLLMLMAFEPQLYVERSEEQRSTVIVLLDESRSMDFSDKISDMDEQDAVATVLGMNDDGEISNEDRDLLQDMSRMDLVNQALSHNDYAILEEIRKKNNLALFSFAGGLRTLYRGTAAELDEINNDDTPTPEGEDEEEKSVPVTFEPLEPAGTVTSIGNAIMTAFNETRGHKVVAVVVISDGQNNQGPDPVDIAKLSHQRMIPIFTIAPGSPQPPRNIKVVTVQAPDVAIMHDPVKVNISLFSEGYDNVVAEVLLYERDESGISKEVGRVTETLSESRQRKDVTILYEPQNPGDYVLEARVTPKPDELTEEDNVKEHAIRIVDNKIRVLYIEGGPRWQYRYLKNALVRDDDTVEIQALLASSDPDFPQEGSPGLEPLLEFPGDRETLFKDYDLLVIGDVHPKYFTSAHGSWQEAMTLIKDFVEYGGGGVLFLSGIHDNPRSYRDTDLEPLIPIEMEPDPSLYRLPENITEAYIPELTAAGKTHPISSFADNPAETEQIWKSLPGMFWYFKAARAKMGATVLAEHPFDKSNYDVNRPLVAVQHYGRGRTMWVAFDEGWRWRKYYGAKYPYTFFRQAISWLRQGRVLGSNRYFIEVDKPEYTRNEQVSINAEMKTPEFKPYVAESISCFLELPNGDQKELELKAVPGTEGKFEGEYRTVYEGPHRIWIGDELNEEDRDEDTFSVAPPNLEFADPTMNKNALISIADAAGGRFFPIQDLKLLPDEIQNKRIIMTIEAREEALWDAPLFYILFGLFITIEWITRKMKRLL